MTSSSFDVVYVDKFEHFLAAKLFRDQIRRRFKLDPRQLAKMSSGNPVRVKTQVPLKAAVQVCAAIHEVGGVCWIQPTNPTGELIERRQPPRRQLLDRRLAYRASSVFPDRRSAVGRRSLDLRYR